MFWACFEPFRVWSDSLVSRQQLSKQCREQQKATRRAAMRRWCFLVVSLLAVVCCLLVFASFFLFHVFHRVFVSFCPLLNCMQIHQNAKKKTQLSKLIRTLCEIVGGIRYGSCCTQFTSRRHLVAMVCVGGGEDHRFSGDTKGPLWSYLRFCGDFR